MSKTNPFNLPPPWNPGYAVPQNVVDEGLERHGYVTQWAQRGSFDNPRVGSAGYAVPLYIREETYGRGAMATKWAPRGSYAGPKVKHWLDRPGALTAGRKRLRDGATKVQFDVLSGTDPAVSSAFDQYGQRAAMTMIAAVKALPPDLREQALKAVMLKIDPTLRARADAYALAERAKGAPDAVALERGLALAMSQGMLGELMKVGATGRVQKTGLLGLGAVASCPNPPPGFTWDPAGAWVRARAGQVPQPGPQAACIDARTGMPASSVAPEMKMMQVGPWLFPITNAQGGVGTVRVNESQMTDGQRQALGEGIANVLKGVGSSIARSVPTFLAPARFNPPTSIFDQLKSANSVSFAQVGSSIGDQSLVYIKEILNGGWAVFRFTHPTSGENWGVYATRQDTSSNPKWTLAARKWTSHGSGLLGLLGAVFGAIRSFVGKIIDVVGAIADKVGDLTCSLLGSTAGKVGAAVAGAAAGGPTGAAAAAQGAEMAAGACASPPAQIPDGGIALPTASGFPTTLLLIGGAGIAALLLLNKKKTS